MSYLRGDCVLTRWDGESSECVYEKCDFSEKEIGVEFRVIESLIIILYCTVHLDGLDMWIEFKMKSLHKRCLGMKLKDLV